MVGPPLPCFRCGICCERWQPLLSDEDVARLAAWLRVTPAGFHERYTLPYPLSDERLLRQEQGACVFLRYDDSGPVRRSACAVHPVRPAVCRAWDAGLDKRACVQGLDRFAAADGCMALPVLYPDPAEQGAFLAAARAHGDAAAP